MTDARTTTSRRSLDRRGHLALYLAVTTWGIAPLFVRAISAPGLTISAVATVMAAAMSSAWARWSGAPLTREVLKAAALGGICHAASQTMAFSAYHETSLAIASLVTTMTPLIVVVAAAPLFGERLRPVQVAYALLAIAGVTAVALGGPAGGDAHVLGDLLAVGALLATSGYLLLMKHRRMAGVAASAYVAGVFTVSAAIQLVVWLASGNGVRELHGWEWWWLVVVAFLPNSFGTALITWAQAHVSVALSSLLVLGTSVIAAAGAWAIYGQRLGVWQLVGGPVVLVALAGVLRASWNVTDGPPPALLPPPPPAALRR